MKESIITLALAALRESPTNPRKTFGDAGLAELAESIKSQGVLQPIVVRRVRLGDPDIRHTHEIVFGHRRFRAATLAGLERIPAIERTFSDEAACVAQLHENLEREDVHPIEEGEAYRALMQAHGVAVEELMQQTGKSRTYIYNRLKLAQVSAPVRAACVAGEIGAEVATLLARVPAVLQPKALEQCYSTEWRDGQRVRTEPMSYRQIKIRLEQGFTRDLERATFPIRAETLNKTIACDACPQNSSFAPHLRDDMGPCVCTDPLCFDAKTAAFIEFRIATARGQGLFVEANDPRPMVDADRDIWHGHIGTEFHYVTLAQALARLSEAGDPIGHATLYLRMDTSGTLLKQCVTAEDARRAEAAFGRLMNPADPPHEAAGAGQPNGDDGAGSDATAADPHAHWTDAERLPLDAGAWVRVRTAVLAELLRRPRTLHELRQMALRELDYGFDDWGLVHIMLGLDKAYASDCAMAAASGQPEPVDVEWLRTWIEAAPADTLGAMLAGLAIDDALDVSPYHLRHSGEQARASVVKALALVAAYGIEPLTAGQPPAAADESAVPADAQVQASADAELRQRGVRFRDPATGMTWTGKGLQPAWLKAALAQGKRLADFEIAAAPARCPKTADLIGAEA